MSDYFERVEQQIARRAHARARRRPAFSPARGLLAPVAGLLVAVGVVAVFLTLRGSGSNQPAGSGHSTVRVYQAVPTAQTPVISPAALDRTVSIMRARARALGVRAQISENPGTQQITVTVRGARDVAAGLAAPGRILFYDWEGTALTPNGRTVASQLLGQDPAAVAISAGEVGGPGDPGGGSVSLYNAVMTAAKQRPAPFNSRRSRLGPEYYLFGRAGTTACAIASRVYGVIAAAAGRHCLLAGPQPTVDDLRALLPRGVTLSQGQLFAVPQGTAVIEATPEIFGQPPKLAAPATQFFVLKDDVALTGADIVKPTRSTDTAGSPDIQLGFTTAGARKFHDLTAELAKRGQLDSSALQPLGQHFAVVFDDQLISVPSIDYRAYPFGIPGSDGADLTGGFTAASARRLATQLRLGALPVELQLVATRG